MRHGRVRILPAVPPIDDLDQTGAGAGVERVLAPLAVEGIECPPAAEPHLRDAIRILVTDPVGVEPHATRAPQGRCIQVRESSKIMSRVAGANARYTTRPSAEATTSSRPGGVAVPRSQRLAPASTGAHRSQTFAFSRSPSR